MFSDKKALWSVCQANDPSELKLSNSQKTQLLRHSGAQLQARQVPLQTGQEEPIKGQEEEVRLQVRRRLPNQLAKQ